MNSFKLFSSLLIFFVLSLIVSVSCDSKDPDFKASIEKIIESRGFNYEKHYIETKDGYILGVYRLINPFVDQSLRSKLKPIVLQHGFLGVGADFLINAPGGNAVPCDDPSLMKHNSTENNNLGFLLANLCYDVWLSNSRGNGYSRNHTKLNPSIDAEFWNFSIDELISYDTPAIIDHILNETRLSSLSWIGHSLGSMIMFGLLSEQPEYSTKVKPFIALAPVFYVNHMKSPVRFVAKIPGVLRLARRIGGEFSAANKVYKIMKNLGCFSWDVELCNVTLFPLVGYDMANTNSSRIEVYSTKFGTSSSLRNAVHFGQNINSGNFHKFDFGRAENERRYGQPIPPVYDLSKINSTSIALLYSKGDELSDFKDVSQLIDDIQVQLLRNHLVPWPSFNHYDFLIAENCYKYINSVVIEILSTFYSNSL